MGCLARVTTTRQPTNPPGWALLAGALVATTQRLIFMKCAYRATVN